MKWGLRVARCGAGLFQQCDLALQQTPDMHHRREVLSAILCVMAAEQVPGQIKPPSPLISLKRLRRNGTPSLVQCRHTALLVEGLADIVIALSRRLLQKVRNVVV
jgi:hypothetical protein